MKDRKSMAENAEKSTGGRRSVYSSPVLTLYGAVGQLTQAQGGSGVDGGTVSGMTMVPPGQSDRRTKENVVQIGTHQLGIGLYLFNYKPQFCDTWGHGRQFGVMADEVEGVMPDAVSVHPNGYKMVDYALLGISRNLH